MPPLGIVVGVSCFILAFILASLVEYWLHRLMHVSPRIGEKHRDHHRRNEGQGVIWEFRDYVRGSCIVMFAMFFYSLEAGIGWFGGGIMLCCFFCLCSSIAARESNKVLLDEDASPLRTSQIRDVASQFWFSCRLVGSGVWYLQACGMVDTRGTKSA